MSPRMFNAAAAWLTPDDPLEARLRIELIKSLASNCRPSPVGGSLFALALTLVNLQWISVAAGAAWLAATIASMWLVAVMTRNVLSKPHLPEDAGRLTLYVVGCMLPLLITWPAMIALTWIPGDPANNAYLITVMCTSMMAGTLQCAPCLPVAILCAAIYLPNFATFYFHSTRLMNLLGPPMQVLLGLIIGAIAYAFHAVLRDAIKQRLLKEILIADLAVARDGAMEASRAKSTLLANMSHELRTPLNAIIGFSDLMRHRILGPLRPPKYGEYIEDIYGSARHLLGLVNDVLDIAKIEAGKQDLCMSEVGVSKLARDAFRFVRTQAGKAGVGLQTEFAPGIVLVGDERALKQILTNLLSNAIKFTRPGGKVTLFALRNADSTLTLGVKDTGIGMCASALAIALTPFGQLNAKVTVEGRGSGLGLPIVKALIEAHGGTFRIESAPDMGTRVWGEFPVLHFIGQRAVA